MELKIQFGKFKGKRLKYSEDHQARPSLARARDVLFNWLYRCDDKKCLDLFAGSGILGLEAFSLGAKAITFIDLLPLHVKGIKDQIKLFSDSSFLECHQSDAFDWLKTNSEKFDIIFLDPPFHQGLINKVLSDANFLKALHHDTLIYLEAEKGWMPPSENWRIIKQKNISEVSIYLVALAVHE
jgi:16S rRNA (guanine966-N2)-methyltransferase